MADSNESSTARFPSAFWCIIYGSGIIGALLLYGVLQERVMTMPYGGELFTVSVFLVFCNRVVAMLFSCGMILGKGEPLAHVAPFWKYLAISVSNVAASTCQYEALRYVSFPVQMLGKSFKMMPVMVWGLLISNKSYGTRDWLIALAVTGGVTEFLMTGEIEAKHSAGNSTYGLMLLLAFLALDGFTSTFQEKLFKEYKTTKYNQMLYVNLGSIMISIGGLIASGKLATAIGYCSRHPAFLLDASALSASAVAGQWFIYSMVKEFGALVFAATMNVRQIASILVSYHTYGHHIALPQILGLTLVFATLFYKSFSGLAQAKATTEKSPLVPDVANDQKQSV